VTEGGEEHVFHDELIVQKDHTVKEKFTVSALVLVEENL
jgi:hypothetical protein